MDQRLITTAIGTAAAAFSITSFLPQIIKMVKTRDVSGVSLRTYAFTVTCFILWVIYGARIGAWPVAVSNAMALLMSSTVLVLKWRYRDSEPKEDT